MRQGPYVFEICGDGRRKRRRRNQAFSRRVRLTEETRTARAILHTSALLQRLGGKRGYEKAREHPMVHLSMRCDVDTGDVHFIVLGGLDDVYSKEIYPTRYRLCLGYFA